MCKLRHEKGACVSILPIVFVYTCLRVPVWMQLLIPMMNSSSGGNGDSYKEAKYRLSKAMNTKPQCSKKLLS